MQQPTRDLWQKVPGYTSDEDEDLASREPTASQLEGRLGEVLLAASSRGLDRPMMQFRPVPFSASRACSQTAAKSRSPSVPAFLLNGADAPLLQETFLHNGMVPTLGNDYVIQWSGPNIKDAVYQSMTEWQRINHFPGSTELTRKDRLWHHFAEMARNYGKRCFDFVPETYVLPEQFDEFLTCYQRTRCTWIVKPNSSSRGRGIFILQDLSELPVDETVVVSRYIMNPLLIQGLKFDLRVYVLVTSFDPLKAYIYREGLTRFASAPYSTQTDHMQDAFRHLTNYSINKNSCTFVENSDLRCDNVGHKWSLSALNKHLRCVGVDVDLMWTRIMDLIVKTLMSVEPAISSRTRQVLAGRENCFELYGFDVLVDDELKPWLLEVNLSPSMQADSPLDWQIKSSLLADTFNLVGVSSPERQTPKDRARHAQPWKQANGKGECTKEDVPVDENLPPVVLNALPESALKMIAKSIGERSRCRNFVSLYPTRAAVKRYGILSEGRTQPGSLSRSGFPTAPLSLSQILASILYGPPPLRSATEMIRPDQRAEGSGRVEDKAEAMRAVRALPEGTQSDWHRPRDVADLESIRGPKEPWSGQGPAVPVSPLPPSVADPGSSLEDREYALMAARRTLRSLSGRTSRPKADLQTQDTSQADEEKPTPISSVNMASCLLLMEYLMRMEAACDNLGPSACARLARSASYARLSSFHRQLPCAAKAFNDAGSSSSSSSDSPQANEGSLIEDLGNACRDSLDVLERFAWQEVDADWEFHEERDSKPRDSLPSSRARMLSKRLPKSFEKSKECKKLLKVLPELRAADLESLLRGHAASGLQSSNDDVCSMLECFKTSEEQEDGKDFQRSLPGGLWQASSSPNLMRSRSQGLPMICAESRGNGCDGGEIPCGPLSEILTAAAAAHVEPCRPCRRPPVSGRRSPPKHRGLGSSSFASWPRLSSAKSLPPATVMKEVTASLANRIVMPVPNFMSTGIRRRSKPRALPVPELLPEVRGPAEGRHGSRDASTSSRDSSAARAALTARFDIEL